MTLLARDEADIVDAQIAFHLHAGVDFVIATDNASMDGTTEILERHERAGRLHLIREPGVDIRQDEWVTRMAHLAATEFGADWVINTDADEFWWPRGGTLKDVLATVPDRYGVVRGAWRHFLPRPDDGSFFADRMTVRLVRPAFPGAKETIYHAHQKVAHRSDPTVRVAMGNHDVTNLNQSLEPLRAWHPIEILHFSFRSVAQLGWKCRGGWWNKPWSELALHQVLMYEAYQAGRLPQYFDSFAVTDELLEAGCADGTLAVDTRLRDVLRVLRTEQGGFAAADASGRARSTFPRADVADDAAYAGEASVLVEIDGIVRAESRVDALEERLASLEHGPLSRLRRLASR